MSKSFTAIQSACPELVAIFETMLKDRPSTKVTLADVEEKLENVSAVYGALADQYGGTTTLAEIEHVLEIKDLV